jgi:hypothetical protein
MAVAERTVLTKLIRARCLKIAAGWTAQFGHELRSDLLPRSSLEGLWTWAFEQPRSYSVLDCCLLSGTGRTGFGSSLVLLSPDDFRSVLQH